ncbi:MAG TPA: radical SAM family heme chaperone HemW [Bacteroidales bacterium]|nr:radical SAM family heme chaperone HemW [Bacteroidales bacterium]
MAGIYIHIPFCKKLCFYCDFYHIIAPSDTSGFTAALLKEISLRREYLGEEEVTTVYFGGGTPSVFSVKDLDSLLTAIRREFRIEAGSEITVELNPDDVTPEYLKGLSDTGFNRISLGIQSWRDEDLKFLNRRHDAEKAEKALTDCLSEGFSNISIDLIYGIPGMTPEQWTANLDKTFSFDIRHLSAYHLTIEKGTVFGKMAEKGHLKEIDEETSSTLFNILINKAEEAGFIHYEISNFGKPGYFSRHNSNYWRQVSYLGLGPSAHSFNGFSRQWNRSDLKGYIKAMQNGKPDSESEELDSRTRFNEYIMTSLRTMWGIDLEYVERTFEKEGHDYVVNMSLRYRQYGLMKLEKNTLVLTNQGKMISDNIISDFMMPDNG